LDNLDKVFVWNRASKLNVFWKERMTVMRDLASALDYIHSRNLIYRDLKPENVGFDNVRGEVKLFDFGLCVETRSKKESANGTFHLTPCTGSLRYMAPEVYNALPYGKLVDTYSFGILLWEVGSLVRPFASYTPSEIRDMVMKWGERPKLCEDWPKTVRDLMAKCWSASYRKRPDMKTIVEVLQKEIDEDFHG